MRIKSNIETALNEDVCSETVNKLIKLYDNSTNFDLHSALVKIKQQLILIEYDYSKTYNDKEIRNNQRKEILKNMANAIITIRECTFALDIFGKIILYQTISARINNPILMTETRQLLQLDKYLECINAASEIIPDDQGGATPKYLSHYIAPLLTFLFYKFTGEVANISNTSPKSTDNIDRYSGNAKDFIIDCMSALRTSANPASVLELAVKNKHFYNNNCNALIDLDMFLKLNIMLAYLLPGMTPLPKL